VKRNNVSSNDESKCVNVSCWDNYLRADIVCCCSCVKMKLLTKIRFETRCFDTPAWYLNSSGESWDARQECWKVESRILYLYRIFHEMTRPPNQVLLGTCLFCELTSSTLLSSWGGGRHQQSVIVATKMDVLFGRCGTNVHDCFAAFIRSFNRILRLWKNILLSGRF